MVNWVRFFILYSFMKKTQHPYTHTLSLSLTHSKKKSEWVLLVKCAFSSTKKSVFFNELFCRLFPCSPFHFSVLFENLFSLRNCCRFFCIIISIPKKKERKRERDLDLALLLIIPHIVHVCMCPSKGRQGENHISTFSKLSKGRDDEFLFFFLFS